MATSETKSSVFFMDCMVVVLPLLTVCLLFFKERREGFLDRRLYALVSLSICWLVNRVFGIVVSENEIIGLGIDHIDDDNGALEEFISFAADSAFEVRVIGDGISISTFTKIIIVVEGYGVVLNHHQVSNGKIGV